MNPKISVIIPCFNVEKHLKNIFEDLSMQTFTDAEFIFINDGGSETIDNITADFARMDSRVVSVRQRNEGVSSARNHGIELAKGEWIVFVDPDDRLENYYLESLILSVENTSINIGIGGFKQIFVRKGSMVDYTIKQYCGPMSLSEALAVAPPLQVPWNKIYRLSFLKDNHLVFPLGVTYLEDEHFNLRLYQKVNFVSVVPDCGYRYMMYDENSALSKYHVNLKKNMYISMELRNSLYKSFGLSEKEIHQMKVEKVTLNIYILIINLFKIGSPLTFSEIINYIRYEIFGDKTLMSLFNEHHWSGDKGLVKICNVLVMSKSPLLISTVFKIMFFIKYYMRRIEK